MGRLFIGDDPLNSDHWIDTPAFLRVEDIHKAPGGYPGGIHATWRGRKIILNPAFCHALSAVEQLALAADAQDDE